MEPQQKVAHALRRELMLLELRRHGNFKSIYQFMRDLGQRFFLRLAPSSLYPAIHQLRIEGLIKLEKKKVDGKVRVSVELTEKGNLETLRLANPKFLTVVEYCRK